MAAAGSTGPSTSGSAGSSTSSTSGAGGSNAPTGSAGSATMGSGGNGNAGTGGAANAAGNGGSGMVTVGDGGRGTPTKCTGVVKTALPAGAPTLKPGEWTDITPKDMVSLRGTNQTMIAQGIAIDPCDVSTLYWCSTPFDTSKGGLFKSTDAGSTWKKLGNFDAPLHVRIDPGNPQHLYVGDGVRGATQGFWVSTDGGATWTMPKGFKDVCTQVGIPSSCGMYDVYDVSVDPSDFKHVLLSFHSPWSWGDANKGSGVLESKDGGESWIPHAYPNQFGYGTSVDFLYEPSLGIGDSSTWMVGEQGGGGHFRTTDAGKTWTKVSDNGIFHGGGHSYYSKAGVLFASGAPQNMRSTDNGATWTLTGPGNSTAVFGDGKLLYSAPALGNNPYFTSPETDGMTWTPYQGGAQKWNNGGPFEITIDAANGILYSSNWEMGAMAMKIAP
jgi:photosystem II stability/assembly factor-like uncharacterized protein